MFDSVPDLGVESITTGLEQLGLPALSTVAQLVGPATYPAGNFHQPVGHYQDSGFSMRDEYGNRSMP